MVSSKPLIRNRGVNTHSVLLQSLIKHLSNFSSDEEPAQDSSAVDETPLLAPKGFTKCSGCKGILVTRNLYLVWLLDQIMI